MVEAEEPSPTAADRLLLAAAQGRRLSPGELQLVLAHVAQAGFDPHARERAGGRLAGMSWQGRTLQGSDLLSPVEVHYLRHVVARQEWPAGTTLDDYLSSLRRVILDPRSGILISQYQDKGWHLAVVRRSEELQGPEGYAWVLIEYRLATGHWVTAFQPEKGLAYFDDPQRKDGRWVRRPR